MFERLNILKHKKRREFTVDLIEGIIKSRSVIFSEIADKIERDATNESIERRIQDYFQKVNIDYQQLAVFLLSFIHHRNLVLTIDRTEWDFGKTQINILCVAVSIGKMAIPIYFEMLDNKSGNSSADDRIKLFKQLIKVVNKNRICIVLMDREFIGNKWLKWLKSEEIDFCVRVPKHHLLTFADGEQMLAEALLRKQSVTCRTGVIVDCVSVNIYISTDKEGELLYLIGTVPAKELAGWYKKRWAIEVLFQALKGRGFDMERSNLRNIEKYRKLFAIVSICYTICWAVGIDQSRIKPVKTKKHGYPQYSVFRRGLNFIREALKKQIDTIILITIDNAIQRLMLFLKTVG